MVYAQLTHNPSRYQFVSLLVLKKPGSVSGGEEEERIHMRRERGEKEREGEGEAEGRSEREWERERERGVGVPVVREHHIQLRSLKSDPKCKADALDQFRLHHCMCTCVRPAASVPLPGRQGPWKLRAPGLHVGSDISERNCTYMVLLSKNPTNKYCAFCSKCLLLFLSSFAVVVVFIVIVVVAFVQRSVIIVRSR